jgi:hypothetical protein
MNKIRETVAPLPIETIKEYFHDKEISFLVDYENSKIADKIFLTYVSNLDIPLDIKLRKDFPKEKLFSLIDAYMDVKTICNVETLTMMVVHILLKAIGVNTKESLANTFMSEELVDEFIETRKEKVSKWAHFLDSSMLFLIYSYKDLNEKVKVEESFPKIEDANYVGLNIVNLFSVPGFMNCYFGAGPTPNMSFFTEQFTKYMFKGKNLFDYFNNEENMFVPLLIGLVEKKLEMDPREQFKDDLNLEVK